LKIEVVATNGNEIRRVAWIHGSLGGISGGNHVRIGEDIHFTYHESGEFHIKRDNIKLSKSFGPKLSEFKGRFMLSMVAFSKEISALPYRKCEFKRTDEVIYIDTRFGQRKEVQLGMHLVENNRRDLLVPTLGRITLTDNGFTVSSQGEMPTHIHVFTSFNPWLEVEIFQ